tara:strand:+ start:2382 stop:4172 length:1791 start_codon:yes stop_codon:yes gene_type:complete
MRILIICLIPLIIAGSCDSPAPAVQNKTADNLSTEEFKNLMFEGYENYKKAPSYFPAIGGINKDISQFGTKGAPYKLCGKNISNIEDVVTDEELVFLYRKNNPNLNISLKDFINNNPGNNNQMGNSGLSGPALEKAKKVQARRQLVKQYLSSAIGEELKNVGAKFGNGIDFNPIGNNGVIDREVFREGKDRKANELAMTEAMNFFLKMHEGHRLYDPKNGLTYYWRDTGNAINAMNALIRNAGFLLKYHSAFANVYANRAACIENKIFKKEDAQGKTILDHLTTKSLELNGPKVNEAALLDQITSSQSPYVPGESEESCQFSMDVAGNSQNPTVNPNLQAPTASAVFENFSPENSELGKEGKKKFKQMLKVRGKLKTKSNTINSVDVGTVGDTTTTSSLSDRIASAQRVTSDFNDKVKAVFKKLREAKVKRNNIHQATETGDGSSADDFASRERQKTHTLKTLESNILSSVSSNQNSSKVASISKKKQVKKESNIKKIKAKNTRIFKKSKNKKFGVKKRKKPKKKNNFAKMIKNVKKDKNQYVTLGKDTLFSIISKAYMREALPRLNEVGIDTGKLPTRGKKYLDSESKNLFESVE